MYSNRYKRNILNAMNSGTGLIPIDAKTKRLPFNRLLEAVSAEAQDLGNTIPNINQIHSDISQVYADVEAQLIAYSTDISKLDAQEIEDKIKQVNRASLKKPELQKHLSKTQYRNVDAYIKNNDVKLVSHQNVPTCMERLAKDISDLVHSADTMQQEEYLKRAVQLHYRFIRIHPFPDSNGRTSRALLNMMTIPKNILIEVPKQKKAEFTKESNATHQQMDGQGYFEALSLNSDDLSLIEAKNMELPIYHFIRENCVVQLQTQQGNQAMQNKQTTQEQHQDLDDIEQ